MFHPPIIHMNLFQNFLLHDMSLRSLSDELKVRGRCCVNVQIQYNSPCLTYSQLTKLATPPTLIKKLLLNLLPAAYLCYNMNLQGRIWSYLNKNDLFRVKIQLVGQIGTVPAGLGLRCSPSMTYQLHDM